MDVQRGASEDTTKSSDRAANFERHLSSRLGLVVGVPPSNHVSNLRFGAVTRDRVEVSSYFLALTNIGVDHWGRYRDVLVPVDGRWLFASREAIADGFSAEILMR